MDAIKNTASDKSFEHATTAGIRVEVQSFFVPEHSDVEANQFFFSYHIRIKNGGDDPIQLLHRHWVITDGRGRVEEVRGPGVIGQQPKILPGGTFEYESFCPLVTPTGMMRGTFQCRSLSGDIGSKEIGDDEHAPLFDVEIPQFFLVEPSCFH